MRDQILAQRFPGKLPGLRYFEETLLFTLKGNRRSLLNLCSDETRS